MQPVFKFQNSNAAFKSRASQLLFQTRDLRHGNCIIQPTTLRVCHHANGTAKIIRNNEL